MRASTATTSLTWSDAYVHGRLTDLGRGWLRGPAGTQAVFTLFSGDVRVWSSYVWFCALTVASPDPRLGRVLTRWRHPRNARTTSPESTLPHIARRAGRRHPHARHGHRRGGRDGRERGSRAPGRGSRVCGERLLA